MKPQSVGPAEHQIETHSQPVGRQNFLEKPVSVPRNDNEYSFFDLRIHPVVLFGGFEISFSDDAQLFGFKPGTRGAADAGDSTFFFRQAETFDPSRETLLPLPPFQAGSEILWGRKQCIYPGGKAR